MLLIVEGVDGVGKTTLVNQMRDRLEELFKHEGTFADVEVLHRGPPVHDDPLEEYELPLQGYRPNTGQYLLLDRWHLGELIYGPILRGESKLDRARLRHIEMFLVSRGALTVHLSAPPDLVIQRRRLDPSYDTEDLIRSDQVDEISRLYHEVTWSSTLVTCPVRMDVGISPVDLDILLRQGVKTARNASHLNPFSTYVGDPKPQFLLLGDVRNQNRDTRWTSAFVALGGSSGAYLLEHLPEDVYLNCGMANSGEEDLVLLYNTLDQPKVVSLGQKAHQRLKTLDIPHGTVPHPQYVRRFNHHSGTEYGHVIRRAAFYQEDLLSWRP